MALPLRARRPARLHWRTLVVAAVAALVFQSVPIGAAEVGSPGVASISSHEPGAWPSCSTTVTTSCVSSFLVNGAAPPSNITLETLLVAGGSGVPSFLAMMVQNSSAVGYPFELSPSLSTSSRVTMRLKLPSSFTPSMAVSLGTLESWQWDASTREITIVAFPQPASWSPFGGSPCLPGSCATTAGVDFTAMLLVGAVDASYNPLFGSKFQGGSLSFNSEIFSTPDFNPNTSAVEFIVGAPANKTNGSPQTAFFKVFIPDAVVNDLWLFADPATLPASFTKTTIEGIGDVTPTRTRVAATATSPAGWLFEYSGFPFSVRQISIGPANPPAGSNPFDSGPITYFDPCGGPVTTNCIAEFTVNGGSPPADVIPQVFLGGPSLQIQAATLPNNNELSPALTSSSTVVFRLKIDSTFTPVVMFGMGKVLSWAWNAATRELTVTAQPQPASFATQCSLFECANNADFDYNAALMLSAGSFPIPSGLPADVAAQLTAVRDSLQGAFFSTNAQNFMPPNYDQVAKAIEFRVSAPHFKLSGGLNTGSISTLIPDGMIINQWGISDPASLTGGGVSVTIEGLGAVAPQVTRVAATATSPAGILIQYQGFSYSTPLISIGQAAASSVVVPPPVDGSAPPSLPDFVGAGPLTRAGPVRLPPSGTIRVPVTLTGSGASIAFAPDTLVTTATGQRFNGDIQAPQAMADPTGGKLVSVTNVIATGAPEGRTNISLSRPATLTLPVPAGTAASDYQPVRANGSQLTFLSGRAAVGGVALDIHRLDDTASPYGLIRVPRPAVTSVARDVPTEPGHHARWAGQSEAIALGPGQLVDLTVRLQNTGDRSWIRGRLGSQVNLGSNAPLGNRRDYDLGVLVSPLWGVDRYATTNEAVVPSGEVGTFTMRLRAPVIPGTYRVQVRPVVDGYDWLEDEGIYLELTVR